MGISERWAKFEEPPKWTATDTGSRVKAAIWYFIRTYRMAYYASFDSFVAGLNRLVGRGGRAIAAPFFIAAGFLLGFIGYTMSAAIYGVYATIANAIISKAEEKVSKKVAQSLGMTFYWGASIITIAAIWWAYKNWKPVFNEPGDSDGQRVANAGLDGEDQVTADGGPSKEIHDEVKGYE